MDGNALVWKCATVGTVIPGLCAQIPARKPRRPWYPKCRTCEYCEVIRLRVSYNRLLDAIVNLLEENDSIPFGSLFRGMASRQEIVCTFLALLELIRLKQVIVEVLDFLGSDDGRGEADCDVTDAFVCLLTAERNDLLERLPDDYQDVIDSIAIDLREAVRNPELGAGFGATPEILLSRARSLSPPQ